MNLLIESDGSIYHGKGKRARKGDDAKKDALAKKYGLSVVRVKNDGPKDRPAALKMVVDTINVLMRRKEL